MVFSINSVIAVRRFKMPIGAWQGCFKRRTESAGNRLLERPIDRGSKPFLGTSDRFLLGFGKETTDGYGCRICSLKGANSKRSKAPANKLSSPPPGTSYPLVRLSCVDSQPVYKSLGYLGNQRRAFIVGCPQGGFDFFCLKSLAVIVVCELQHLVARYITPKRLRRCPAFLCNGATPFAERPYFTL